MSGREASIECSSGPLGVTANVPPLSITRNGRRVQCKVYRVSMRSMRAHAIRGYDRADQRIPTLSGGPD